MAFETSKCTARRLVQGHLQKLVGLGLDVGAGDDPFLPLSGTCRAWDRKRGDGDAATLPGVAHESLDYVYSSHCLEHLPQPAAALARWIEVVKPGGYLYVVVPDYDLYEGGRGIRNKFHRAAFSLYRPDDARVPLFNILNLIREHFTDRLRLISAALCDDHFDYSLKPTEDQTRRGAVCHIEILAQKCAASTAATVAATVAAAGTRGSAPPPHSKNPPVKNGRPIPTPLQKIAEQVPQKETPVPPKANLRAAGRDGDFRPSAPQPMLFTRSGGPVGLQDIYRGAAAFLICGGPSLATHDLAQLERRGVLTMAVNNAATVVRPKLWCSVDDPSHFCDAIWRDPDIMKFVPRSHFEKRFMVRNDAELLELSREKVGDMPAVVGFERNDDFQAARWLYEPTFNWGNRGDRVDAYGQKGSRSVMYVAVRLAYYLGIRRLFLLGCDFRMEQGKQNYAFEQARSPSSVRGNNSSYHILNIRLKQLLPYFEQEGFEVFNCTPNSGLTVFPHKSYEEALQFITTGMPTKLLTRGMYDRGDHANQGAAPRPAKPAAPAKPPRDVSQSPRQVKSPPDKSPNKPSTGIAASAEVTILVDERAFKTDDLPKFWKRFRSREPQKSAIPLLVLGTEDRSSTRKTLGKEPRIAFASSTEGGLEAIVRHVTTPWALIASATEAMRLDEILAAALAGDRRLPLYFTGTPVDPTGDQARTLEAWWKRRSGGVDAQENGKVHANGVPDTSVFVSTRWLRQSARGSLSAISAIPLDRVLEFCARRRGEIVGGSTGRLAVKTPAGTLPINGAVVADNSVRDGKAPKRKESMQSMIAPPTNDLAVQGIRSLEDLFQDQCRAGSATDKGSRHSYLPIYEMLFAPKRQDRIKLLEIGVGDGHSLRLWRDYFKNANALYGLDIRLPPLRQVDKTVKLVQGSAVDPGVLRKHFRHVRFDVVIDDASHRLDEQRRAFELYYPQVTSGGVYVIEDIQDLAAATQAFADVKPVVVDLRNQKSRYDDVLFLIFKR